jgi:hypothetical protein
MLKFTVNSESRLKLPLSEMSRFGVIKKAASAKVPRQNEDALAGWLSGFKKKVLDILTRV